MAMAPPLTFTIFGSHPMSLLTARAWAANASLASTISKSSTFQPAFFNAFLEALTGPTPIIAGSRAAVA